MYISYHGRTYVHTYVLHVDLGGIFAGDQQKQKREILCILQFFRDLIYFEVDWFSGRADFGFDLKKGGGEGGRKKGNIDVSFIYFVCRYEYT